MAILDSIRNFIFSPVVEEEDEAVTPIPEREKKEERREKRTSYTQEDSASSASKKAKIVTINAGNVQKIVVVKLDSCAGVKTIIDQLKEKIPVVFNIARLDRVDAGRAVDVVYGASYALNGAMEKVSNDIFLVTPFGVEIAGDIAKEIIGARDFSWDI